MKIKDKNINKILEFYSDIANLNDISALLGWDQEVNMPISAVDARASQLAYLTGLITEKWSNQEFKSLIETADANSLEDEEKAILRNVRHIAKFYYQVPKKTIVDLSLTTSKAFSVWQQAKSTNNFKLFQPHLEKLVDLNKQIAHHLGFEDNPYDALLNLYEQGLTAAQVKRLFSILQPALTDLLQKISRSKNYQNQLTLDKKEYSQEDQEKISHFVLNKIGYDFTSGRQDISSHPFTTSIGWGDVRITNRYKRNNFMESIMVAMHEGGHALYDQGYSKDYALTPLAGGVSLGIHESQSRFWENQIGRSKEFIKFLLPVLQAYYPEQLTGVDEMDLYRHFNQVKPGLIRVEADEVTYNLHIALRFELENALLNDKIKVEDLPDIWREKMKKYLDIIPQTDAEGVLQDVHWSHGTFGYFPTYTLGNLYAAQFTNSLRQKLDLDKLIGDGNFEPVLSWLRENIHIHGSLVWPGELIQKVTGEDLTSKYFLNYLEEKYKNIYS